MEEKHMERLFFSLGSFSGGLGVVLGAFGAHILRARMTPDFMAIFETGVRYQMYHAFGLLIVGMIAARRPTNRLVAGAGWLFIAGIVLFSGSLYILTLSGLRWLGMITPVGGTGFIVGWFCLALAALREKPFAKQ
jgi:uncharacterized membrane protein YgdD (TMEM256/DUF423 family)